MEYPKILYFCRPKMKPRLKQMIAWVLLVAFCGMTGTKAFHHHHWKAAEDVVCPLDGVTMSHHSLGHSILEALDEDDNDCAICHFTVTKVVIPICLNIFNENPKLFLHPFVLPPCFVYSAQGVSFLRAPPVNG